MIVQTNKGWVALKKDQFSYKVLGTYATKAEAEKAEATAKRIERDNKEDRILRNFFWEEII